MKSYVKCKLGFELFTPKIYILYLINLIFFIPREQRVVNNLNRTRI
jgi:hypothetical protein